MKTLKNLREKFEDVMYAITFAEAGEFETARETMRKKARKDKRQVPRQKRPENRMSV